jgi:hypothetical protein
MKGIVRKVLVLAQFPDFTRLRCKDHLVKETSYICNSGRDEELG